MKIDHLITQYLYQQKKLNLPGIGTFTMENGGIHFNNSYDPNFSNELVEFVRTHTGKMTSLALADLESFVMLNKQFLNIGKALHLEGIGTLVKSKEGSLEFTSGDMIADRLEERMPEPRKTASYEAPPRRETDSGSGRNWLVLLGIIATLAIVIWGGWKWSNKNAAENNTVAVQNEATPPVNPAPVQDSLPDTTRSMKPVITDSVSTSTASAFKFIILQTNRKARALARYNQLRELKKDIRMETADSIDFKLYFLIQVAAKDTIRTRDSLSRFYDARVRVE